MHSKHVRSDLKKLHFIEDCYPPDKAQMGAVFYDSGDQCLKVFDGAWRNYTHGIEVELTYTAEQAIDWSMRQMHLPPSTNIANMAAKYPLVADAIGQLEVALKLCQNLENGTK